MDTPPIWPTPVLPIVTFVIAVGGYFIWRRRMVLKRRFEVAEKTLATKPVDHPFDRALDQIFSPAGDRLTPNSNTSRDGTALG
jgi:hypothetical protein